ncbi:glycosyltransferase [Rhodococcus hoagii]|nr:glycosyltransferase [Prescottella equi]
MNILHNSADEATTHTQTSSAEPRWTLITVTFNSAETLREFWSQPIPDEVEWVVVDNNSTDDSRQTARELGARVLPLGANSGFAAANNIGLRSARGEYVAFVNPDVTVDFRSLGALESTLTKMPCIVAPQLINPDGTAQPNGRGYPTISAKVSHRANPAAAEERRYRYFVPADKKIYVAWAMGAALCATRKTFEGIGGWNERFFLYYEDAEISLRAWRKQVPTVVDGSINWVHGWARETTQFRLRPWLNELRSAATFYLLHPGLILGTRPIGWRYRQTTALLGRELI